MTKSELAHMKYTDLEAQLCDAIKKRPDLPYTALSKATQAAYEEYMTAREEEVAWDWNAGEIAAMGQ